MLQNSLLHYTSRGVTLDAERRAVGELYSLTLSKEATSSVVT